MDTPAARTSSELADAMYGSGNIAEQTKPAYTLKTTPPAQQSPSRTTSELADAMYGSQAVAPVIDNQQTDTETPESRTGQELGEALYTDENAALPAADAPGDEEMQAIRDDPLRSFYSADVNAAISVTAFRHVVDTEVEVEGKRVKIDQPMIKKSVSELRAMALDLGLSKTDISLVKKGIETKISAQDREATQARALAKLDNEHGKNATLAFRCAEAYVAKNPKLSALLGKTGAGNDPETVALIARKALQMHREGKLKLKGKS